jgi:hypothetical protein
MEKLIYKGLYPSPNYGFETYGQYYNRICELKNNQGFQLSELTWKHWAIYSLGSPENINNKQNELIP